MEKRRRRRSERRGTCSALQVTEPGRCARACEPTSSLVSPATLLSSAVSSQRGMLGCTSNAPACPVASNSWWRPRPAKGEPLNCTNQSRTSRDCLDVHAKVQGFLPLIPCPPSPAPGEAWQSAYVGGEACDDAWPARAAGIRGPTGPDPSPISESNQLIPVPLRLPSPPAHRPYPTKNHEMSSTILARPSRRLIASTSRLPLRSHSTGAPSLSPPFAPYGHTSADTEIPYATPSTPSAAYLPRHPKTRPSDAPNLARAATEETPELTPIQRRVLERLIRVDQAGELGANYIYRGQHAVVALKSDKKTADLVQVSWGWREGGWPSHGGSAILAPDSG